MGIIKNNIINQIINNDKPLLGVPLLLQIPEINVNKKGDGIYGKFTVTNDITEYTRSSLFSEIKKEIKVFVQFSDIKEDNIELETIYNYPKGFAVKFFTEEGEWDLIGNNTPVFFNNDLNKLSNFINSYNDNSKTIADDSTIIWKYWSSNPETLHQLLILMSNRGASKSFHHMNGYGVHTYTMLNSENKHVFVKFHFKTAQGIKSSNPENQFSYEKELINLIKEQKYPKWFLKMQVMNEDDLKLLKWDAFDVTKIWPHSDFPLIDVGVLELNELFDSTLKTSEHLIFSVSNIIDGIGYSLDKVLQNRLLASDGLNNTIAYNNNDDNDHYTQAGNLFGNIMTADEKLYTVNCIVEVMNKIEGPDKDEIINKQLCHFFRANIYLGLGVAQGLGVQIDEGMMKH